MKKVICLVLSILMCVSFSSAEEKANRNAFLFVDLYSFFLEKANTVFDVDASYHPMAHSTEYGKMIGMPLEWYQHDKESEYWLSVPAGNILVSVPEFEIIRAEIHVMDFGSEESKQSIDMTRAMAAYAAFEYDRADEDMYSMLSKYGLSEDTSAFEVAAEEFLNGFEKALDNPALINDELMSVHMMSGENYDYSLLYIDYEIDVSLVLIVKSK